MELENSETESETLPAAVLASASNACSSLLPVKSRELYEKTYNEFHTWCTEQNISNYTEPVFLAYFSNVAQKGLTASLWPKFSMLKSTLHVKKNIDIGKFNKLIMYIKRQTEGHVPKKSKVLEKEQVLKFIFQAPNNLFLMIKVALIFGIAGALRKHELLEIQTSDVEDLKTKFLITIPGSKTKTKVKRIFTIVDDDQTTFLKLIRQYITLRPQHTKHTRFFVHYRNNKCTANPVGINTFGKIPCTVAIFLKLDQPQLYTGHCFRRSSASILSDTGADFAAIKRHGGWKSTRVAEAYIEDSIQNKANIAKKLLCTNETATASNSQADINITSNNDITSTLSNFKNVQNDLNLNINSDVHNTQNLSVSLLTLSNCQINSFVINMQK